MAGIDLSKKKRVALVCSGGAVKAAAFHVGVALGLEQTGFRFLGGPLEGREKDDVLDPSKTIQVYVGSSAGSLVATFLAQGGKLKELVSGFQKSPSTQGIPGLKYWEMLFPRMRSPLEFFGIENFFFSMLKNRSLQSPFGTDGIARYLRSHVIKTDRFSDLEPDLFVVATELNRSRKVVFGKYKSLPEEPNLEYRNDVAISDSCAASMALPPLYHPYGIQIEGRKRDYYDGEIWEPLSAHVARDVGCDLVICSYTHQPVRFPVDKGSLAERGISQVVLQGVYQAIEQKIRAARGTRAREKALVDIVSRFFKEHQLPDALRDKLIEEVEARMTYKADVDYIYIHPRSSDVEMFMLPHFSLKREKTEAIVRRGIFAALTALRGIKISV